MTSLLMRSILAPLVVLCLTEVAAADPVVAGEEHCVVNVQPQDRLYIRRQPGGGAAAVAGKRYGDCGIRVNGPCAGAWCPVEDGHALGFAHRRYLAMVSPAMYCVTGVASGDALNLRAWPSSESRVVTRLGRHQCGIAFLPYARGQWQKVRAGGWQGWVNRRHLSAQ